MTLLLPLYSSIFFPSTISRHHLYKSSSSLLLSHHLPQNKTTASNSSSSQYAPIFPWSAASIFNGTRYYSSSSHSNNNNNNKPKIVVIMGPTGSGKSRLSMHLATRFFPTSEIINSDKIQVYSGLDITTNKIPIHQQLGVTHHLLGHFHPSHSRPEFTPSDFRAAASSAISLISNRRNLPLLVGGSNSFLYALIADQQQQQRYQCCFIRIDVSFPVLNRYLVKRVDDMMGCGMLEELTEFFKSKGFLGVEEAPVGLRKAIGVAELEPYFRESFSSESSDPKRKRRRMRRRALLLLLEEGIENIKRNTCELARRQVDKMRWLTTNGGAGAGAGWGEIHKVDGTEAMRAMLIAAGEEEGRFSGDHQEATEIWETQVLQPSVKIVKQFLDE